MLSIILFIFNSCVGASKYNDVPRITEISPRRAFTATVSEPAPEYLVSPGDALDINVYRRSDLKSEFSMTKVSVGPDGTITIPLAGKIQVQNLTSAQLSAEISQALSDYFVDPVVSVNFATVQGRQVLVLGEVKTPGNYSIGARTTAMEGILLAGGVTIDAETSEVILIRTVPKEAGDSEEGGNPHGQLAALDLDALLEKADVKQNVILRKGDILYVPPNTEARRGRYSKALDNIILPLLSAATVVSTIVVLGGSSGN